VCFYKYSLHSKPPVLGSSSSVCMLHDKPTYCFVIFLIELPYGKTCAFKCNP
jgi:hypothetical protein